MNILLTGATGYIGSYMLNYLSKNTPIRIIPLCRKLPSYLSSWRNKFEVIECDVTKLDELKKEVPKDVDVIIHLAALNDVKSSKNPEQALIVNGLGTRNMLEIAKGTNCKNFIYFSVLQVYGRELNGTLTVDSPIKIENDYTFTHYVAEGYCRLYSSVHNLNANIIRLSYSFGCPVSPKVDRWTLIPECFCLTAYKKGEIRLKSSG